MKNDYKNVLKDVEYKKVLHAKAEEVKKSGSEVAEKLLNADADIDHLKFQIIEQDEAIQAGSTLLIRRTKSSVHLTELLDGEREIYSAEVDLLPTW